MRKHLCLHQSWAGFPDGRDWATRWLRSKKRLFLRTLGRGRKRSVAHREGRTRSLQIPPSGKSLTLYPIELGGPMYLSSAAPL